MSNMRKRKIPSIARIRAEVEAYCETAFEGNEPKNTPRRVFIHAIGNVFYLRFVVTKAMDAEMLDMIDLIRAGISRTHRIKVVAVCHVGLKWTEKKIVTHVNEMLVNQGWVEKPDEEEGL